MSKLRDQARFERVGWQLKFLIPFWILQMALSLALMGLFAHQIALTAQEYEASSSDDVPLLDFIWECTNVALSLVCVVFIVTEIIKTVEETLTPPSMLYTHSFKITCSGGILGLNIYFHIRDQGQQYPIIGTIIGACLLVVTLVTFIYSILTYRRQRQYEDYHLTGGVKQFGYKNKNDDMEMGNNVHISAGRRRRSTFTMAGGLPTINATPPGERDGDYHDGNENDDGHNNNDNDNDNGYARARAVPDSPPSGARDRSGSAGRYDHRRSTLYDSYLEQHSGVPLQTQIDRTVAAEFGWTGGARPSSGQIERFGSVVGTGEVRASMAGPATDAVTRASERGSLGGADDATEYRSESEGRQTGFVGRGPSSRSGGSSSRGARERAQSNGEDLQSLLTSQYEDGPVSPVYRDSPDSPPRVDRRPL